MNALKQYDAACRALALCTRADEVKGIRDKAVAIKAYAKQAGDTEIWANAARIIWKATDRLGMLLNGSVRRGRPTKNNPNNFVGLPDGVSWRLSSAAQLVASLSESAKTKAISSPQPDKEMRRLCRTERQRRRHQEIAAKAEAKGAAIEGRFPLIYADPPWRFEVHSESTSNSIPSHHYPTMTMDEIMALEVDDVPVTDLPTDDAVLFMWCTSANLISALAVLEAWGFTYKTHAVWDKEITGNGYIFRNQHEVLLYGSKGKPPAPMQPLPSSVFRYRRGKHSEKPPQVRDAISRMYPDFGERQKIELFARGLIEGWTTWGNESLR